MKLSRSTTKFLIAIAVCAFASGGTAAAQDQTPTPPPVREAPPPKPKEKEKAPKFTFKMGLPPGVEIGEGTTSERSITVDPKVSISVCVTQGRVRVSGWGRNEVRAFVSEGSRFGFRVLQKSVKDGSPVLISLVGVRQLAGGAVTTTDCIAADEIELDVPENAALSIKGRESATTVDSVRKVAVSNAEGDIIIRNVAQGVRASTYQGNLTVQDSEGGMSLESASGNIVVFSVNPLEAGDAFRAKTNSGSISMQKMGYRLADITSISGTVLFSGELLSGGSFSFGTTNGAIRLAIPQDTSCRITATYGFGNFNSEIPIKTVTEDIHPGPVKTINAVLGSGDAILRLTTNSGSIAIKKLQ